MRFLLYLLICLSGFNLMAQETPVDRTFVAFVVNDRDSSITWYREMLKMELLDSTSIPENQLRMANLVNPDFHVELIEIGNSLKIENTGQLVQGIFKVGRVISNFDKVHNDLKSNGANFRSEIFFDEKTKLRSFIILDPDGNRVQFFGK